MEPPVANFTVNRTFGFRPMTVQFTDTSTGSPPLNYSWDFGDTATSHEQNPVHTFTEAGSYQVSLTVSNSAGNDTWFADQPIDVLGPIGGDKGYYLVHCNVDGASVFLDDYYKGMTQNGSLLIQVYTTATPYFSYTVEKDGYQTFTAPITQHPAKGQTVDLYANLTPAAGKGSLYVTSYPTGATILINGTDRGMTNKLVSNVSAGVRNLTLVKPGYQPYTLLVMVPAGGTKILAPITLTKGGPSPDSTGTLYVTSYPSNATILINGTDSGRTNQFVYNVPAGIRNLTLTKAGYLPYTTAVNVPASGTKVLPPITLQKGEGPVDGMGTLYVASYATNATILINGTDFGKTNQFVYNVPAGNRNLTLTKTGYRPYTMLVTVPAGGMKILPPITLSPLS
jgi:PKD repeat protein